MSDLSLWRELKAGSQQALERIYREQAVALLRYGAKFSRDQQLVEDCVQELFVELWQHRATIGETDHIRKYLFVSLRRKVIRQLSNPGTTQPDRGELHDGQFGAELGIDTQLIQVELDAEQQARLQQALAELSPRQQEILYLKYFADLDYHQIGEIMDLNYQSARNLVSRALEALRQVLGARALLLLLFYLFKN